MREPSLLITAHLDTIRPMWDWSGEAGVRDGRVYGLGAQDDKACIVAAIQGLLLARDAGVPVEDLSVGIGLCVDEEIGGTGSIEMARALQPPFVVGLEGTELGLGTAEAGFVEVWCHLRGVGVHGALRELGENAIETAHALIDADPDPSGGPARASAPRTEHPDDLGDPWWANASTWCRTACSFHLDWRVNPGGPSAASLLSWLEEATARAGGEVELVEVVEPFEIDPGAPVAAALGDAVASVTGARPDPTGMVAWTDAHNFVDLAGSQTVVFGPGHLRNAHREDEWVEVDGRRHVRSGARGDDRRVPRLAPEEGDMTTPYDVAIVGGGHNGLVSAFYLARAGLRTVVLERRSIVGGACVTEEFAPGFRASPGAYVLSMLRDAIWRDFRLRERGLIVDEAGPSLNVYPDGSTFVLRCGSRHRPRRDPRSVGGRRESVPGVRGVSSAGSRRRCCRCST